MIQGATNPTYEGAEKRVYGVVVGLNHCADTQSCLVTSANNLDDVDRNVTIEIYPLPLKDE